ncbi:MAG: hypothetical protein JWR61_271 [Ferruginibacter sp.]|nr:hypothetical protein [Ferruginibacter sp.]
MKILFDLFDPLLWLFILGPYILVLLTIYIILKMVK